VVSVSCRTIGAGVLLAQLSFGKAVVEVDALPLMVPTTLTDLVITQSPMAATPVVPFKTNGDGVPPVTHSPLAVIKVVALVATSTIIKVVGFTFCITLLILVVLFKMDGDGVRSAVKLTTLALVGSVLVVDRTTIVEAVNTSLTTTCKS